MRHVIPGWPANYRGEQIITMQMLFYNVIITKSKEKTISDGIVYYVHYPFGRIRQTTKSHVSISVLLFLNSCDFLTS